MGVRVPLLAPIRAQVILMKVDVVTLGSFQKKLEFSVPALRVKEELDKAYRDLGLKARIAGFRKGKVPRKVLEAKFGPRVKQDVANTLIQEGYSAAVTDHQLEPVGRPQLQNTGEFQGEGEFNFTITVEVKPEVELQSYTGLEVVYPSVEITDADLDRLVKATLESRAKLSEVSDRAVAKGDLVIAELVVTSGDEEVAREVGTMIRTDGDPYYPGVETLLVGASLNEEKTGTVSFSDKARNAAVKGRELSVTAKVLGIQSLQVPELTDAVAAELGYEGGVDGMRTAIRLKTQTDREPMARNQARANLLQALIAANPFQVPDGMIDSHLQMLVEELRLQQAFRKGDPRKLNFSPEQIADLRVRAEFAAKGGIILDQVSRKETLEVTDADIEAKYQEIADQREQSVEAIRGYFVKDGAVDELRARLLEEKTLDWLLERAKIVGAEAPAAAAEEAPVETPAPAKAKGKAKAAAPAEAAPVEAAAEEAPAAEAKPKRKRAKKGDAEASEE